MRVGLVILASPCPSLIFAQTPGNDVPRTVYSVADLHGDFDNFKLILEGLGVASFDDKDATWTGGQAILVSTGDTVDRGPNSLPIYQAFETLAAQAEEAGGEVVNVMGNHDLMNLQGDMRYVPKKEMSSEGDYGGAAERNRIWSPEGPVGKDLRSRYVAAALREGTLFVHAGLEPTWLQKYEDLDGLNRHVRELVAVPRVSKREAVFGDNGPFWTRSFSLSGEKKACRLALKTLKLAGADRMTVGHTIQDDGVGTRCSSPETGPRLILADTAISSAYGGTASAVQYVGRNVTAIYFEEGKRPLRKTIFSEPARLEAVADAEL